METRNNLLCWIITEGMMGTQNQCVALAQTAGFSDPVIKKVKLRQPWKSFTPYLRAFSPAALAPDSDALNGPWPDVIIASGRKAIAPSLWIKKQNKGKTVLVIVQSPVVKDKNFDLVVAPHHDNYQAPNAIAVTGALSHLTAAKLEKAYNDFPQFAQLPSPRVAVLIGGTSRTHQFTPAVADRLIAQLKDLQQKGHGLMITASRRTPEDLSKKMQDALRAPGTDFWDGTGANPFQGYMAHADVIIVTEDSVSMACEAISTGKPTYIIKLEGGSPRFKRFHDYIVSKGYCRWFDGKVETWNYTKPADLENAAARIDQLLVKNKNAA
jgi:mitochondrial fission protein ELM1